MSQLAKLLADLPYYQEGKNVLRALPGLIAVSLACLTVSLFSTREDVNPSDYLNKAQSWNEADTAAKLSQIKIVTRLMPSYNTPNNLLYLDWVSMTTDTEQADALASQSYLYNKSLHLYNDTREYFPVLNLASEYVPVGDAVRTCINLAWVDLP